MLLGGLWRGAALLPPDGPQKELWTSVTGEPNVRSPSAHELSALLLVLTRMAEDHFDSIQLLLVPLSPGQKNTRDLEFPL